MSILTSGVPETNAIADVEFVSPPPPLPSLRRSSRPRVPTRCRACCSRGVWVALRGGSRECSPQCTWPSAANLCRLGSLVVYGGCMIFFSQGVVLRRGRPLDFLEVGAARAVGANAKRNVLVVVVVAVVVTVITVAADAAVVVARSLVLKWCFLSSLLLFCRRSCRYFVRTGMLFCIYAELISCSVLPRCGLPRSSSACLLRTCAAACTSR